MSPACLQTALEGPHARRVAGGCATVVTAVVACVAAVAAARMAWPDPGLCEPVLYSVGAWPVPGRRLARVRPDPGLRLATVYRL